MGRRRQRDKHLPRRVYLNHGAYYFRPIHGKAVHLGRELPDALAKYATLVGANWSGRTLGDVIDRYRIEILPLKRSAQTRTDQARGLDRLKNVFGHMLPASVTAQQLYAYQDGRRDKRGNRVPVAARHEISLLGHVFAKAIRWGVTSVNPVRAVEKEPKGRRTRYVSHDELAAVLKLASPRMRVAIELAWLTGQRRGDLLSLKREQLTEEGIVFQQSKTGAGVLVQWSPALRAVIERAKKLAPQIPALYVIRKRNGKPYSARGFSAIWQRLMAKAVKSGIERFTFHDIRAKAASDKASIEAAAALLGHASTETTKRIYKRNMTKATPTQ